MNALRRCLRPAGRRPEALLGSLFGMVAVFAIPFLLLFLP